tara:strand:+ start:225 stop:1103 length:879 start_codon:yes stop_codon:yes gene_type:complete
MEWPKKVFFLCIYAIAGVSSPNCGDKVEVQLLFMAFFINILYMPVNEIEFDSMKIALSKLGKKTAALVKIAQEGDCSKPDYSRGCELLKRAMRPTNQSGGKKERKRPDGIKVSRSQPQATGDTQPQPDIRILLLLEDLVRANAILNHPNFNTLPEEDRIELQAAYADSRQQLIQAGFTQQQLNDFIQQMQQGGKKSRKKRGKGMGISKMRRKKHMSSRQPKNEYLKQAAQILNTYLNDPNVAEVEKGRRIRNLALQLEDDAKKGGRRKRKSRKKRRKRKTKRKRRKSRRRRR